MVRRTPTYSTSAETEGSLPSFAAAPFVTQDLTTLKGALDGINLSAENVSKSLTKAFATASQSSIAFNGTLTTVAASLARVLAASLSGPLQQGFSSLLTGFTGGGSGGDTYVAPFADGGIVASPTFFGGGGSVGLMGERGAEAILPLARGPNGQLGVASQGGGGGARPVTVNVSIATDDAESFRRSEAQIVGALARAVARGQRVL